MCKHKLAIPSFPVSIKQSSISNALRECCPGIANVEAVLAWIPFNASVKGQSLKPVCESAMHKGTAEPFRESL